MDCALLPDWDTCAAVRIANQTTQPFMLPAGTEVGQASLATEPDDVCEYSPALNELANKSTPIVVSDMTMVTVEPPTNFTHLQLVIDSLPKELAPAEREKAIQFIQQYSDVFICGEFDLGRTSLIIHHIDTGDAKPIRQPLRRHPQVYLNIIDAEIAKMEAAGVIEPSYLPWVRNVVVVKKHDSTPSITLDYHQLNNVT